MEKVCHNCEKEFETNINKKKFCSDNCRVVFSRKKVEDPNVSWGTFEDQQKENAIHLNTDKKIGQASAETPAFDTEKLLKRLDALKWVKEVEEYCASTGITPTDLIQTHQKVSKMTVVGKKHGKNEENQSISYIGNPKTKIVNPVYEGSNAFFLRHGAFTWAEVKKIKQKD